MMTKEEKQILFKDLLPRQLYGVKAHYQYYDFVGGSERLIKEGDGVIESIDISLGNPVYIDGHHVELENIKPYLRPMSSMTSNEKAWYDRLRGSTIACAALVDWLNANHFDYRGLIEKELALEAPEGMYEIG